MEDKKDMQKQDGQKELTPEQEETLKAFEIATGGLKQAMEGMNVAFDKISEAVDKVAKSLEDEEVSG